MPESNSSVHCNMGAYNVDDMPTMCHLCMRNGEGSLCLEELGY